MKRTYRVLCLAVVGALTTVILGLNVADLAAVDEPDGPTPGAVSAGEQPVGERLSPADESSSSPRIRNVAVSPAFFNPTVGQVATITFEAAVAGVAKVAILDRDRFAIRALPPVAVQRGPVAMAWDGRDDAGAVVPDEAWNVRIELGGETYDPSRDFEPVAADPQPRTYSRVGGVLSYKLERPSRVHIEGGQATQNPRTGRAEGPILKTIVNREPRAAGAVVEMWNGFDESGTIRVSDLPRFVISVLATSLPDNALITVGNRRESFLDYAKRHRPAKTLVPKRRRKPTHHHIGLDAFEDRSPSLRASHRHTNDGALRLQLEIEGASAPYFLRQPMNMSVYVDERRVLTPKPRASPLVLTIPAESLPPGERRIAVNWGSEYGPAAVSSFLVDVPSRRGVQEVRR